MKLRTDIKRPIGRLLRVCIVARYSKEEQNPKSIEAQVLLCKQFLRDWGFKDSEVAITVIADAEVSGELVDRPGIIELRVRIEERADDLILAEDSSRLYRNPSAADYLVCKAVDNQIRAIFPGDDIDTAEDNWRENLGEAQNHHSRTNSYTRKRIKRAQRERWENGAAMGPLKTGYKRPPSTSSTMRGRVKGPFFDEIDPLWAPTVKEVFERIARREPPWAVAEWLTQVGLPKTGNAISPKWSGTNVIALVRRAVYRGVEEFGVTITKKHYGTGKGKQHKQDAADVLTRLMEHHRIVSDHLWHEANAVIDRRITRPSPPKGIDHPLYGIPRDSRNLLSQSFFCDCCGGDSKMRVDGRRDGGYRCAKAKHGGCWNKATALRDLTHKQIAAAITAELMAGDEGIDVLVRQVERCLESDAPRQQRLAASQARIQELTRKCERLLDLIEKAKTQSSLLLGRLQEHEHQLTVAKAEFAHLSEQASQPRNLPSREQIRSRILLISAELLDSGPEARVLLQRLLAGPILAVPYLQFGSNKVVLRAEFKINVLGILPAELDRLLQGVEVQTPLANAVRVVRVDLFPPSAVPQNAALAWKLRKEGLKPKVIAQKLNLSKRQTSLAMKLGREMEEANLQGDPYIRLTESPNSASRWRSRRTNRHDDDRAAGDAA